MTTYLLTFIVALQLADIVTTYLALTRGKGVEANGILARLMARFGLLPTLLVVKGLFVSGLVWATLHLPIVAFGLAVPWLPAALLGVVAAGYLAIVVNNVRVLRK